MADEPSNEIVKARDVVANERTKLTAAYLNTAAGGLFTAGVAAPVAAAVFGVTGATASLNALTVLFGTMIFLACSVVLHMAARAILNGLKP